MSDLRLFLISIAFIVAGYSSASAQNLFSVADQTDASRQDEFVIRVDLDGAHSISKLPFNTQVAVEIPIAPGENVIVDVERFEVFAPAAPRNIITADGSVPIAPTPSTHLRGHVRGHDRSNVVISVFNSWVVGKIELSSPFQQIILSPLENKPLHCVVAKAETLEAPEPWNCGTDDFAEMEDRTTKSSEMVQAGTTKLIELAVEGDYEYYLDHGQNENRAIEYAESVIAAVSAIFERDVEAEVTIKQIEIWTIVDPYPGTTSGAILGEFRAEWRANHANVDRTLAHLFSGVNGIGGVAYLNALCSSNIGYAVSGLNNNVNYPRTTYAWDTDVTSHELGHNVGSRHTHSCSWNPPIDSCYDAEGDCFDDRVDVKGTIMSYCHLTNLGKTLRFHDQVSTLMKTRLANAGCVATITDLEVSAGPDVSYCKGEEGMIRGSVSGGTPPLTILWAPAVGLENDSTLVQKVTSTQSRDYILTVTDARDARGTDTVSVTVHPGVSLTLNETYNVCLGAPLHLTMKDVGGFGPIQYRWMSGEIDTTTESPVLVFWPTVDQLLSVTAIDANGCGDETATQVFVYENPVVTLGEFSETFCIGDSIRIDAFVTNSSALSYEWYRNDKGFAIGQSSITAQALVGDKFTVVVTSEVGCSDTAEVLLDVHDIRMSTQSLALTVPSIPPCDDEFQSWVTILNEGTEPIVIAEIEAVGITASIEDLPTVIEPGSSRVVRIDFGIGRTEFVDATVVIREATCGKELRFTVRGEHGFVSVVEPDDNLTFNSVNRCVDIEYLRHVEFPVLNSSGTTITITGARAVGHDRVLRVRGNANIPAGEKATISIEGLLEYTPAITRDSIVVTYSAQGCTGTIGFGVDVPYTTLTDRLPAEVVFDQPVSPALEDVEKTFEYEIASTGIVPVEVSEVIVKGPFSTSLTSGLIIETNTLQQATVTFHPSQVDGDGETTGSIELVLDECHSTNLVFVRAILTVVSVDDEVIVDQQSQRIVDDGRLEVLAIDAEVHILNIKGERVYQTRVFGTKVIDVSQLVPGLHLVDIQEKDGRRQRFTILIQ